jgi:hypothetical protein
MPLFERLMFDCSHDILELQSVAVLYVPTGGPRSLLPKLIRIGPV